MILLFKLIAEDKEMWDAADKNQDGILDVKEFQVFSNPEEYPEMIPLILNQTLKNKDLDKDGSISFQVWIMFCPVIFGFCNLKFMVRNMWGNGARI